MKSQGKLENNQIRIRTKTTGQTKGQQNSRKFVAVYAQIKKKGYKSKYIHSVVVL